MKKLLLITLLSFAALFSKAQNTVTLEAGTSPLSTYQLRYKAVTPDSLNHLWIYNGITLKYNRVYTATEANQRFAPAGSGVTSVLGTINRVTVSPTSGIPVIDISATFEALLEKNANKTATQSSSAITYPNWLGVTNYVTAFGVTKLNRNGSNANSDINIYNYKYKTSNGIYMDTTDASGEESYFSMERGSFGNEFYKANDRNGSSYYSGTEATTGYYDLLPGHKNRGWFFSANSRLLMYMEMSEGGNITRFSIDSLSGLGIRDDIFLKGPTGFAYYGANYTDNTYIQKKYVVDNFLAIGGTAANSTRWNNETITTAAKAAGDVMQYDGSKWVNATVSVTGPLQKSGAGVGGTWSITQATTSTPGYVSATDWNTFNNKVSSSALALKLDITNGTAVNLGSDVLTLTGSPTAIGGGGVRFGVGTDATKLGFAFYSGARKATFETYGNSVDGYYHLPNVLTGEILTNNSQVYVTGKDFDGLVASYVPLRPRAYLSDPASNGLITAKNENTLSNGFNYSVELINFTPDRTFSTTNNWTGTNWTFSGGYATHTAGSTAAATLLNANLYGSSIQAGKRYVITLQVSNHTAGSISISLGGGTSNLSLANTDVGFISGTVTATTNNGDLSITPGSTFDGRFTDISVREVLPYFNVTNDGSLSINSNQNGLQTYYNNGSYSQNLSNFLLEVNRNTIGSGTISVTASGTTITGTGTNFTGDFVIGETIYANSEAHIITAIASRYSMTTDAWTSTFNGAYRLPYITPFTVTKRGLTNAVGSSGSVLNGTVTSPGNGTASLLSTYGVQGIASVSVANTTAITTVGNQSLSGGRFSAQNQSATATMAQVNGVQSNIQTNSGLTAAIGLGYLYYGAVTAATTAGIDQLIGIGFGLSGGSGITRSTYVLLGNGTDTNMGALTGKWNFIINNAFTSYMGTGKYFFGTSTDNGTGNIVQVNTPISVADPVNTQDAVTKGYLNGLIGSFTYRGGGQTTLIAGTKTISVTGVTTSSQVFVNSISQGGTVSTTFEYAAVPTAGTITITALTTGNVTNTLDTSTLSYFVIN